MKLNLFMCFFFFEKPFKDSPLYSPIFLTHCFRYLQKSIKESYIYLSYQFFFETPHKTLKSQQTSANADQKINIML